jgi:hypothetical protein
MCGYCPVFDESILCDVEVGENIMRLGDSTGRAPGST